MSQQRKNKLAKLWTTMPVGDQQVQVHVFKDLTDQDLQEQFTFYHEREDWEYLAELKAEADSRGIVLKNPRRCDQEENAIGRLAGVEPYNAPCEEGTGKRVPIELEPISPFELDMTLLNLIQNMGLMPYMNDHGQTYYLVEPDGVIWGTTDKSRRPGVSDFYYDPNLSTE